MIRFDDHKTGYMIDPWRHLGPKRRRRRATDDLSSRLDHRPVEKCEHFRYEFFSRLTVDGVASYTIVGQRELYHRGTTPSTGVTTIKVN
jgi:hypothetical protein